MGQRCQELIVDLECTISHWQNVPQAFARYVGQLLVLFVHRFMASNADAKLVYLDACFARFMRAR